MKSNSGMALLNIIMLMVLVGALVVAGATLVAPLVRKGKINETKSSLNGAADAIISWSVANGRIPDSATFDSVVPTPVDSWGKHLYYIFDSNLATTVTNNLCRYSSTSLTTDGTNRVGFIVMSLGDDIKADSAWTGVPAFQEPVYYYPASNPLKTFSINNTDLYRVITLDELQNKAGCFGATQGRLKILNNELPSVCAGSTTYPATLFPDGGVSGYTWSLVSSPSWLKVNPATGVLSPQTVITSTAGTYQITAQLTDSQAPASNSVQKNLKLVVKTCTLPGTTFDFANNLSSFSAVAKNGATATKNADKTVTLGGSLGTAKSACLWYPQTINMVNGFFRGYLEFKFRDIETSVQSSNYGDGFVVTLMNGAFLPYTANTCSTTTNGIGFAGLASGTDRNSLAVEFDTYPITNNTVNDPRTPNYYNHITILNGTNVNHVAQTSLIYPFRLPTCSGSTEGCYNTSTPRLMEDGLTHKTRIEVLPGCNLSPPGYLVINNSPQNRYYRINYGSTNSRCSVTAIASGALFPTPLQPGWTLNSYTNSTCSVGLSGIAYSAITVAPGIDTNGDGCLNLDSTDAICPAATKKYRVFNSSTNTRYFTIATSAGTGPCLGPVAASNATTLVPGGEFSPYNPLQPGWTLNTYTNATCTAGLIQVSHSTLETPATKDTNGDNCVNLNQTDTACALVKTWMECDLPACTDTENPLADTTRLIASNCISMPASMNNVVFGITSGNSSGRSQQITFSNFKATVKSTSAPVIPKFRIWNNSGSPRWIRINNGATTSPCPSIAIANGEELTSPTSTIGVGWTLYTYRTSGCANNGRTTTTYANINGPPVKDTNGDSCVQISSTTGAPGVTDRSCAPVVTTYRVFNNSGASRVYKISDGTTTGVCRTTANGAEFSPMLPMRPGWTLTAYTNNARCNSNSAIGTVTITYADAVASDSNADRCVNINKSDKTCP